MWGVGRKEKRKDKKGKDLIGFITKLWFFMYVMYGCESGTNQESRVPKNWCFWTVVLEETLESPLDCKETQPVHPKGDQSWVFTGRTDAEAETPNTLATWCEEWLTGKDPDAGKDWAGRRRQQSMTWLDGHEFEQALGVDDGQGSLVCCSPWGCKELDTTERLN